MPTPQWLRISSQAAKFLAGEQYMSLKNNNGGILLPTGAKLARFYDMWCVYGYNGHDCDPYLKYALN